MAGVKRSRGVGRFAVEVFGVGVFDLAGSMTGLACVDGSVVEEGASGEGMMEEGIDVPLGESRGEP